MSRNHSIQILADIKIFCCAVRREQRKQKLRYVYELHRGGMKYRDIAALLPNGTKKLMYYYCNQAKRLNRLGFLYNKTPVSTYITALFVVTWVIIITK